MGLGQMGGRRLSDWRAVAFLAAIIAEFDLSCLDVLIVVGNESIG